MKKEKNEVAEIKENAIVVAADDMDFEEFAGEGMEGIGADDVLIPRLTIAQSLSPQIQKKKAEYIEGCEIGDIIDVGTGDRFEDGVNFLPVFYQKVWIEWAPRESGKGLIAIYDNDSCLANCEQDDKGKWITPEGNMIQPTAQYYGYNLSAGGSKCFISFASSQMKKAKKWMTLVTSEKVTKSDGSKFVPPIYFRTYDLTTVEESGSMHDWSGWKINRGIKLSETGAGWTDLLADARDFRKSIIAGTVRADEQQGDVEPSPDGSEM